MAIKFSLFGLSLSFADFRVDGPGVRPPDTFKEAQMEGYVFKFNYGLSVGNGSRFCFMSTNAREFSESGGSLRLHTGLKFITLDVASPITTVPQRWSKAGAPAEVEPAKDQDTGQPQLPDPTTADGSASSY